MNRKATAERLSEYIRITHIIGGRVLRVITDGIGFTPDMHDFFRIFADAMRNAGFNQTEPSDTESQEEDI